MQFLLLAYDATDADALNRRMGARQAHIETIDRYKKDGHMHIGAALLDDAGKMVGSVIIAEFLQRADLNKWLAEEPYVVNKIWDNIQITPCQIGPSFKHLIRSPIDLETLRTCYRERILTAAKENKLSNVRVFGTIARGGLFDRENDGFLVSMSASTSLFDIGGLVAELEEIFGQYIHVIDDSVDMSKVPYDTESIVTL